MIELLLDIKKHKKIQENTKKHKKITYKVKNYA